MKRCSKFIKWERKWKETFRVCKGQKWITGPEWQLGAWEIDFVVRGKGDQIIRKISYKMFLLVSISKGVILCRVL